MILMIEDEPWRNDAYVYELEDAQFTVRLETGADAGWQYFVEHQNELEAVILDIMMAPGKRYVGEIAAQGGLRTGLLLYRDMRRLKPALPVVFLTNVSYDLIAEDLPVEPTVLVLRKLDYLPDALPNQMRVLLQRAEHGAENDTDRELAL